MKMTRTLSLLLLALFVAACNVAAADDEVEALDSSNGMEEAREWIAMVDGARFAEAWEASGAAFRKDMDQEKWELAAVQARTGLGPLTSRKLRSATHTRQLAGMPEGEYLVIRYNVGFERRPLGSETLILEREKDSRWRVAGYSIR
jgi:hypothetical protein